jgi:hypothetical protein
MSRKDLNFIIDSLLQNNKHSKFSYEKVVLGSYIAAALSGLKLPQERYYNFALAQELEDVEEAHREEYKLLKAYDVNFSIISFGLSLMSAVASGEIKIEKS